jgi:hypothetical protein
MKSNIISLFKNYWIMQMTLKMIWINKVNPKNSSFFALILIFISMVFIHDKNALKEPKLKLVAIESAFTIPVILIYLYCQ